MLSKAPIKFFHSTICKTCKKDEIITNTHRTDFVGYESGNKTFNIIANKIQFQDGGYYRIKDNSLALKDLAESLMKAQGDKLFLNEYPEECDHLQYIDLDAKIDDDTLDFIVDALVELTDSGEVKVLRNNTSGKIHLVMNIAAESRHGSFAKKAISVHLCKYLWDNVIEFENQYTWEDWSNDIFDAKAAGIRSAFSVKVRAGIIEKSDMYLPATLTDYVGLSVKERAEIIAEYSIYAEPTGVWLPEILKKFRQIEKELVVAKENAVDKFVASNEYDGIKKTIKFSGKEQEVSGALINDFIYLLPSKWADKRHWSIVLKHVKSAATLTTDFLPEYFLHKWSAKDNASYNKEGNDRKWYGCQTDSPGQSLTWLRNLAQSCYTPDVNLLRGDLGMANIFASKTNSIKIVDNDCSCYIWDDNLKLWMHRNSKWIGNEVSSTLEKVINERMEILRGLTAIDVKRETKYHNRHLYKILSYRGSMDVVNKVSPMLEDLDFIKKINLQPDLLPIQNGSVVDLRTGHIHPRTKEHNFTFECPVSIDRDYIKIRTVTEFMLDICGGDLELLEYMQITLGYCITGRVDSKSIFVWWGAMGNNGKSTVLNLSLIHI